MKPQENLAKFFYEAGTLRKIARAHRQTLLTDDLSDNIASHSFRVSVIGRFLAPLEKADIEKVVSMCLFHDVSETRCGDQNWVHKLYVTIHEDEITTAQFQTLPFGEKILSLVQEYQARKSPEAKIAKDADLLDQILLLKEYAHMGNKEAQNWLRGNEQAKRLSTKSGKALAKEIVRQNPSDWWTKNLWMEKRRK